MKMKLPTDQHELRIVWVGLELHRAQQGSSAARLSSPRRRHAGRQPGRGARSLPRPPGLKLKSQQTKQYFKITENSDDNDKETQPQQHGIAKTSGSETELWNGIPFPNPKTRL